MSKDYERGWAPHVTVAARRRKAAAAAAKLRKAGRDVSPVEITGRKTTTTFWGTAWCQNLEAYSDYANRLPRGRSYVRHGAVVDLQIEPASISALVSGTDLYAVEVRIKALPKRKWAAIKRECGGKVDSLIALLQGSLSRDVMEIVTRKGDGLFPSPPEISLNCSCPDWATMCKHVAATLYGVGARLDHEPELLFTLRGVDPMEMVGGALDRATDARKTGNGRMLDADELSSIFDIDIDTDAPASDGAISGVRPTKRTPRGTKARESPPSQAGTKTTATSRSSTARGTGRKMAVSNSAAKRGGAQNKKAAVRGAAARKKAATESTLVKVTDPKAPVAKSAPNSQTKKKRQTQKASVAKAASGKRAAKKTPTKRSAPKKAAAKTGTGRTRRTKPLAN